jgi:hypothetical protein
MTAWRGFCICNSAFRFFWRRRIGAMADHRHHCVGRRRNVSTTFVNVTPYHTNRIRHLFKGISILSVVALVKAFGRIRDPRLRHAIVALVEEVVSEPVAEA